MAWHRMHRWSLRWAVSAYSHHWASLKKTEVNYAFILFLCSSLIFNLLSHVPCRRRIPSSLNGSAASIVLNVCLLSYPVSFVLVPYNHFSRLRLLYSRMEGILNSFYEPQHNTTQHIHKRIYTPIHRLFLWGNFPRLCFTPIPMRSSCPVSDWTSSLKLSIQTRFFFQFLKTNWKPSRKSNISRGLFALRNREVSNMRCTVLFFGDDDIGIWITPSSTSISGAYCTESTWKFGENNFHTRIPNIHLKFEFLNLRVVVINP